MPHITHEHGRTWISLDDLREDLADGTLPPTVEVHHPPWTGAEARPAHEIAALAEAITTPTAQLARRLERGGVPWKTGLAGLGLLAALWLKTTTLDDFLTDGVTALGETSPLFPDLTAIVVVLLMLPPVAVAERIAGLLPALLAAVVGGTLLATWGVLAGVSDAPLLGLGAAVTGAAAALGAVQRKRPTLPPLKRDIGQWTRWSLLGGMLLAVGLEGSVVGVPLVGLAALGAVLGWVVPTWGLVPLAMAAVAVPVVLPRQAATDPGRWLFQWHDTNAPLSGFHAPLPHLLPPLERTGGDGAPFVGIWETSNWKQGLSLTVKVQPTDKPAQGMRFSHGTDLIFASHVSDNGFETLVTCEHNSSVGQESLCGHILERSWIGTPFSVSETGAALTRGLRHAELDHLAALLAVDRHASAWRFLRAQYPLTGDMLGAQQRDQALFSYAMAHGECAAAEAREPIPLGDYQQRIALFEACLAEVTAAP